METESTYRQPFYYIVYSPIFSLRWKDIDAALRRLSGGYSPYYKAKSTNAQGCWIANKMHNGHGYVKLKVAGGGRREFYAHHLALIHAGAWSDVFWVHCKDAGDYEISHICHNTRCFNPEHLMAEPKAENLARNSCQGLTWIQCPCPCGHRFNPCQHPVPCILPPSIPQSPPTAI